MVRSITDPRQVKYLLGALVALVVADGIITKFLVGSGLGRESNPFLENIVGDSIFLPLKIFGAILCAVILWDIHRRLPKVALVAICSFIALYSVIVLWNVGVFFIAQSQITHEAVHVSFLPVSLPDFYLTIYGCNTRSNSHA